MISDWSAMEIQPVGLPGKPTGLISVMPVYAEMQRIRETIETLGEDPSRLLEKQVWRISTEA
jgi:hypothetical protein